MEKQEWPGEVDQSNWLQDRKQKGPLTIEEIEQYHQEASQELVLLQKLYKEQGPTDYRMERDLEKMHITL